MPNRVDINAAFPAAAATAASPAAEAGLGELTRSDTEAVLDDHLEVALELTTHFRMCFSRVEATENGMEQNRHL